MHRLVLLLSLLVGVVGSEAAILYVDKDNACPGSGTTGSPYCSIQNAFTALTPGDTVRIRDSATPYDESAKLLQSKSGTSGARNTIEPDVGHNPTIRWTGNQAQGGAIWLDGAAYTTVQNLTFDGAGVNTSRAALYVVGGVPATLGVRVLGNTFKNWGGTGAQASTQLVRGALMLDGGYCQPVACPNDVNGAVISGNTFQDNRQSHILHLHANNTVIENNTFIGAKCGMDSDGAVNTIGIKVIDSVTSGSSGVIIRNNTFRDWQPKNQCEIANIGGYDSLPGIWCDVGPAAGLVEGNHIYNINQFPNNVNDGAINYQSQGIFIEAGCLDWTVRNNFVHHIGSAGIRFRAHAFNTNPPQWTAGHTSRVYNNTIYSAGGNGLEVVTGFMDIRNNIVRDCGGSQIGFYYNHPGVHTVNYNLYYDSSGSNKIGAWAGVVKNFAGWKTDCGCDANAVNDDPDFVTLGATPDLHLQSSSPARDAGTSLSGMFTTDIDGQTRTGTWDMGADEAGTTALLTTVRLNAGGAQFVASDGTYEADQYSIGGSVFTGGSAIANTTDDALYQTVRFGNYSYSIPMANGSYSVTLKFAEISMTAVGQRVFHVSLNGTQVLTSFDIFAAAGGANIAVDQTFPVTVAAETLTVAFTSLTADLAMVSAVAVVPAGTPPSVLITSPPDDPSFTGSTPISVSGTASDADGTLTSVALSCNPVCGAPSNTGTLSAWSFSVPVALGSTIITVTATDNAAQTGQDQVTVHYTLPVSTVVPPLFLTDFYAY